MNDKFLVLLIVCLAAFTGYAWFEIWQNRASHPLMNYLVGKDVVVDVAETNVTVTEQASLKSYSPSGGDVEKNKRFTHVGLHKSSLIMKCRDLLREERFNELNQLLAVLESETEQDIANEARLFLAYRAFDGKDATIAENLDKWIAATPQSYQPYLARANFNYGMAWKARGTKWASETKKEQFDEMNRYFGLVSHDLEVAIQKNDRMMVTYAMLIRMLKTSSQKEAMLKVINSAVEKSPASYEVRRAFIYSITPRWGGSLNMMDSFAKYSQKDLDKNPRIKWLLGAPYVEQGDLQSHDKAYSKAIESYTKALNAGENHIFYGSRGETYYRAEQYSKAVTDLTRAIELYPEEYEYYRWRSKSYLEQGDVERALADSDVALMLAPDDEYTQNQHARVISKLDRLGYEQATQHNLDEALHYYGMALRSAPDNGGIYSRRASVYIDKGKYDAAKSDLREAIRLEPKTINHYKRMDWLLAREKEWDQIISYWDQFIALDPKDSWAYYERGGACFRKGDIEGAVRNAKIAADMGNEDARKLYEKYKNRVR